MMTKTTEALHQNAPSLDKLTPADVAKLLYNSQCEALAAISTCQPALVQVAQRMADAIRTGHRVVYVGAGSSGLISFGDACEVSQTFGINPDLIHIAMPGGIPTSTNILNVDEDATEAALRDSSPFVKGDLALISSASGTTPYAIAFLEEAKKRGMTVVGIANNAGTPLLEKADVPVFLPTPPEALAGSTRLGAGTAQKAALNTISTLAGLLLGHVYDGMMVNMVINSSKLRARGNSIVCAITGVSENLAEENLNQANGNVKLAILLSAGAKSLDDAAHRLEQAKGNLRLALPQLA